MPLPSSGAITLGQVNTELSRSATASINMNDSAVRTLAQVGGANTVIAMQNLRGKSAAVAVTLGFNSTLSPYLFAGNEYEATVELTLYPDGTITYYSNYEGQNNQGPTTYFTPTTNAGANFEFRLNVTTHPGGGNAYVNIFNASGAVLHTILTTGFTPYFNLGGTFKVIQVSGVYYDHPPGARGLYGTLEIRHTSGSPSISRFFDLEFELY